MTTVAAIATPYLSPERLLAVGVAAGDAGLDELWLWEDSFFEGGISSSAAVLGATERMRVGIGVLPFPLRNVALAAMEIATLDRMFPGRFLPGLGHGVQDWMGQAGVRARSVLTLEREYVTALRALLAGEAVTVEGDYVSLDRVKLEWPPPAAPALHLAATGPRSLEVSGEVGDGTILVADTRVEEMPRIRSLVAEGRARSGRAGDAELTVFQSARADDVDGALRTVEAWATAGAHRVALQPRSDERDPEGFVRFVAEQVQPRFH